MSDTVMTAEADLTSRLPGAAVLRRIQRMLFATRVCLVLYSIFTVASKAGGIGGVSGDGGFLDAAGNATSVSPSTYGLTLHPSPFVYIAVGLLIVWVIPAVLTRAQSETAAIRIIDVTSIIIIAILLGSMVISVVWFMQIPIDDTGHTSGPFPIPFGWVDYTFTPGT